MQIEKGKSWRSNKAKQACLVKKLSEDKGFWFLDGKIFNCLVKENPDISKRETLLFFPSLTGNWDLPITCSKPFYWRVQISSFQIQPISYLYPHFKRLCISVQCVMTLVGKKIPVPAPYLHQFLEMYWFSIELNQPTNPTDQSGCSPLLLAWVL